MQSISSMCRELVAPLVNASPFERGKWLILVCVFSAFCFAASYFFYLNYRLGLDFQVYRCMDEWVYIIDIKDRKPVKDKIYAIESRGAEPVIADGQMMAKIIRGVPGDKVTITKDENIYINGKLVASGMDHLHGVNPVDMNKFIGSRTLGPDEFWVMGTRRRSFDSRYYGPVHAYQIKGRAYALF